MAFLLNLLWYEICNFDLGRDLSRGASKERRFASRMGLHREKGCC